jgi:hypothetical protein
MPNQTVPVPLQVRHFPLPGLLEDGLPGDIQCWQGTFDPLD